MPSRSFLDVVRSLVVALVCAVPTGITSGCDPIFEFTDYRIGVQRRPNDAVLVAVTVNDVDRPQTRTTDAITGLVANQLVPGAEWDGLQPYPDAFPPDERAVRAEIPGNRAFVVDLAAIGRALGDGDIADNARIAVVACNGSGEGGASASSPDARTAGRGSCVSWDGYRSDLGDAGSITLAATSPTAPVSVPKLVVAAVFTAIGVGGLWLLYRRRHAVLMAVTVAIIVAASTGWVIRTFTAGRAFVYGQHVDSPNRSGDLLFGVLALALGFGMIAVFALRPRRHTDWGPPQTPRLG